jgi:glutathione S-transferase
MKLYGSSFSPFVRKVMAYATERGLDLSVEQIGLANKDPEFLRASPLGKMPGFTDGDFAISDSTAILAYLERKYPDGAMVPASAEDYARIVWFEEFADTVMSQVTFKCFFNRVVAPLFMKIPGNEELAVEGETVDLPKILDYLETVAPAPDGFLVGGAMSIADISVATMFVNYAHAPVAVDKSKWPKTYAWVDAILSRPSFAPVIAQETAGLAKLRGAA